MATMFLFVAIGVTLFLTPYFLVSFILFGLVSILWQSHTAEREEVFIAVLAALAFLGVVTILVEDFIGRWLLS